MEKLFELTFQDQTLNPQVGTFTDASQTTGTFTLEDGEYYLTNGDTKGFYTYAPIAIQPDSGTDNKITVEFDLKVISVSALTHAILGSFDQLDINDAPVQTCWLINYNQGDIEFAHSGGSAVTLIAAADVVVDQWYHFKIECSKGASSSMFYIDIDGSTVAVITSATSSYKFGIVSVLGTGLHACDECGIKNIRLITDDDYFVGRTALNQALKDTKGYVDTHCMDLTSTQTAAGDKTFSGTTTTHDVIPAATDTYNLGSSAKEYNNAYIKALTINGTAAGDILTHNASEFVPVTGGPVMTHTSLSRSVNTSYLTLNGGTGWGNGSSVAVHGKDVADISAGSIILQLVKTLGGGIESRLMYMYPDGTWTWNGSAVQLISDQRYKQQITEIDDKLLDAWEDVELSQFKYNDAVGQKKDKARLHTGYVVQQIDKACKKHGVDISAYGLYCHEEYAEETEEIEVEQKDGTKTKERKVIREANEHYSLRYTEAYAVECKYLRRCIARLTSRIEELEKGNKEAEK